VPGPPGAPGAPGAPGPPVYVADAPPVGAPDNALWWESDSGLLYVRYNDGNSTQWVVATPQPDFSTYVQYSVQAPAVAQQTQARQNVYAAPFDAMAYSGIQINGSMDVSQHQAPGTGATTNTAFICDGWRFAVTGVGATAAMQQVGLVPGFTGQSYVTVQTPNVSLAASDGAGIYQIIEGYRIAKLGWGTSSAQPITLAFWSSHHRTGLYSGVVRNGSATRVYAFTYTHSAADVPQYNTVTIPGDTAGPWAVDNGPGMTILFCMGQGTTYTAPSANTWLAGVYNAAPGQINGVAATSDVFRLGGVIILPGIEAPSAARSSLIMRPYDQELLTCKRYYEKNVNFVDQTRFVGEVALGGTYYHNIHFTVTKRANPTVTVTDGGATQRFNLVPDVVYVCDQGFLEGRTATAAGYGIFTSDWIADARI